ncbi:MAG: hypothetical protein HOC20_14430 [Chloroflexi bacterium]|nr:hypothetical protein [Chloroflexota bacterium]
MAESEQEVEEIAGQIVSVFGEGGICPTSAQWRHLLLSTHDGKIAM